jgi:GTP-binding protein
MQFIDEVEIHIASGHGGKGCINFRREKYVPFGGPDGGDGGPGGNVYFEADKDINTLFKFRGRKTFVAPDGENGSGGNRTGANGEDLILYVPEGTQIKDALTGELMWDLTTDGTRILVCEGGKGGHGNTFFKTSVNQAPQFAQDGLPGTQLHIKLELKLLADIGLIGLPNAGKSTLISVISSSRPKIADYPFTTLVPNLGVMEWNEKTLVVADVPGLIAGASLGKGLGTKFLKHIERTKALVHLIDVSMIVEPYEALESYTMIRQELEQFNPSILLKKEIICLTKIDAVIEEDLQNIQKFLEDNLDKRVLPISAVSSRNMETLKGLMMQIVSAK